MPHISRSFTSLLNCPYALIPAILYVRMCQQLRIGEGLPTECLDKPARRLAHYPYHRALNKQPALLHLPSLVSHLGRTSEETGVPSHRGGRFGRGHLPIGGEGRGIQVSSQRPRVSFLQWPCRLGPSPRLLCIRLRGSRGRTMILRCRLHPGGHSFS